MDAGTFESIFAGLVGAWAACEVTIAALGGYDADDDSDDSDDDDSQGDELVAVGA